MRITKYRIAWITIIILLIVCISCFIFNNNSTNLVVLRKFPYPYQAGFSICSDIDETHTLEEFLEIQRYLCTEQRTDMGTGLGLEIGNSFYMYSNPPHYFSYFQLQKDDSYKTTKSAQVIRKFIQLGFLDVIHTWGNYSTSKKDFTIKRVINELEKYNCKIDTWVNHSHDSNPQCLGDYGNCLGDNIESDFYHSALTLDYGIKFIWVGSITPIIGQDIPFDTMMLFDFFKGGTLSNALNSLIKFNTKVLLGLIGINKYTMETMNQLTRVLTLDDGRQVYEFKRFNNNPDGVWKHADVRGLAHQISSENLDVLKKRRGYMIVFTHLGKNSNQTEYIEKNTQDALKNLANEFNKGNIWVTTTSKLLNYHLIHNNLDWEFEKNNNKMIINIKRIIDEIKGPYIPSEREIAGITFNVLSVDSAEILINGKAIQNSVTHRDVSTGKQSIMVPLEWLKYPEL